MIASMMTLVLVGAVLGVVVQQSQLRHSSAESSLAIGAALNTLEQLRTVPESTLASLDGSGFDVAGSNGSSSGLQAVAGDPDGLPGTVSVVVDKQSGGATLYRVVATVVWKGTNGRRRIALQALMGDRK